MEFCGAGSITDLVKGVEKLFSLDNNSDSDRQNLLIIDCRVS